MSLRRILFTHGVNHSPSESRAAPGNVQRVLHGEGLDVHVSGASWSSLNSAVKDWYASWFVAGTFEDHLDEVLEQFLEWEESTVGFPRVWIAHSWGNVLAYHIKRTRSEARDVPMIGIGAPFTHPWLGRRLRHAKRVEVWPTSGGRRPIFFANEDDPITATWWPFGRLTTHGPLNTVTRWIDVPNGKAGQSMFTEHDPRLYLEHPDVLQCIMRTARPIVG